MGQILLVPGGRQAARARGPPQRPRRERQVRPGDGGGIAGLGGVLLRHPGRAGNRRRVW